MRATRSKIRVGTAFGALALGCVALGSPVAASPHGDGNPEPQTAPYSHLATFHLLQGTVAFGPTNAWAVGWYDDRATDIHSRVMHWDGSSWKNVTAPSPGVPFNFLEDIAAVSPSDMWAVGLVSAPGDTEWTSFLLHWDGTGWTQAPAPDAGAMHANQLNSVAADTTDDVWAVGSSYPWNDGEPQTLLVQHWDGTSWTDVAAPLPTGADQSVLTGVSAVSPTNAWAVGYSITGKADAPLIEHWNGTVWKVVGSPALTGSAQLNSVTGSSAHDLWATGTVQTGTNSADTVVEHYDGTGWSVVTSPDGSQPSNTLYDVTSVSPDDVWAVGVTADSATHLTQSLIEHWDGTSWTVVPSANPSRRTTNTIAVSGSAADDAWTVGYAIKGHARDKPLTEHWDGTSWTSITTK